MPVQDGARLQFDLGAMRFVKGEREQLCAIDVAVPDPQAVRAAASAQGCAVHGNRFHFCGVALRPVRA